MDKERPSETSMRDANYYAATQTSCLVPEGGEARGGVDEERQSKISMRDAALATAIETVCNAMKTRGMFP